MRAGGVSLRVEVSDADATLPEPREAAPDDEGDRGLALVAALAAEWGAERRSCGIGKTVWFVAGGGLNRSAPPS